MFEKKHLREGGWGGREKQERKMLVSGGNTK
jgi:hypothetical protein